MNNNNNMNINHLKKLLSRNNQLKKPDYVPSRTTIESSLDDGPCAPGLVPCTYKTVLNSSGLTQNIRACKKPEDKECNVNPNPYADVNNTIKYNTGFNNNNIVSPPVNDINLSLDTLRVASGIIINETLNDPLCGENKKSCTWTYPTGEITHLCMGAEQPCKNPNTTATLHSQINCEDITDLAARRRCMEYNAKNANLSVSYSDSVDTLVGKFASKFQTTSVLNLENIKSVLGELNISDASNIVQKMEEHKDSEMTVSTQKANISKLQLDYDRTLREYSQTYDMLISELMKNPQANNGEVTYGANIISNGMYYYLNEYGYTQKYSQVGWTNRPTNCSNQPITIDESIFSELKKGAPMGIGQSCKIAGNNIQNKSTKERAWVDITGTKHIYPSELWEKKSNSCNMEPLILEEREYTNIPTGSYMQDAETCDKRMMDPKLINKLEDLNKRLSLLANILKSETEDLNQYDNKLSAKLSSLKQTISNTINQIDEMPSTMIKNAPLTKNVNKLENVKRDTHIRLQSSFIKYYYLLGFFSICMMLLLYNITSSTEILLLQIFLLICFVYAIYKIIIYYIKNIYSNDKRKYTIRVKNVEQ